VHAPLTSDSRQPHTTKRRSQIPKKPAVHPCDPGIHLLGWSREKAATFLAESGRFTDQQAETLVDRSAVWPAQLTAYDTGALEIRALRKQAQDALGPHFDIREFHTVVLGSGGVTLPMLRQKVQRWLASKSHPSASGS